MPYYHRLILYFDGASRSNPHGPAGCGWVLKEMDEHGADGDVIARRGAYLGYSISNNQAEYQGLLHGLNYLVENEIQCDTLYVRGDAEIVLRQMDGEYNVNSDNIRPHYRKACELVGEVDSDSHTFRHVSRGRNWEADALANKAIEENGVILSLIWAAAEGSY